MPRQTPVQKKLRCEYCKAEIKWGNTGKITHTTPVCDTFIKAVGRGVFYIQEINTLAREFVEKSIVEVTETKK